MMQRGGSDISRIRVQILGGGFNGADYTTTITSAITITRKTITMTMTI